MTFAAGRLAHAEGEPLSSCPFAPADPDGADWRAGWVTAEAEARGRAGTYGATSEELERARATFGPPQADVAAELLELEPVRGPSRGRSVHRRTFVGPIIRTRAGVFQVIASAVFAADQFEQAVQQLADQVASASDEMAQRVGLVDPSDHGYSKPVCAMHGPAPAGVCRECASVLARSVRR